MQWREGAIDDALDDDARKTFRALPTCGTPPQAANPGVRLNSVVSVTEERFIRAQLAHETQQGIENRSGLNPADPRHCKDLGHMEPGDVEMHALVNDMNSQDGLKPHASYRSRSPSSGVTIAHTAPEDRLMRKRNDYKHLRTPSWLGFSVLGDESMEGPIYNYARAFTWFRFAEQLESGFSTLLRHLRDPRSSRLQVNGRSWDSDTSDNLREHLNGDLDQVAAYCGLQNINLNAYASWSELDAQVFHHLLFASLAGIIVQWGTTGPAILVAYKTPSVGLGCRSGSYLLYGVLSTVTWFLLALSALLSHSVMYHEQTANNKDPEIPVAKHERSQRVTMLCGLAVTTRLSGKTIGVCNAFWLVTNSMLEFTGSFENCWCQSDALSLRGDGWTVLYKSAADLAGASAEYWAGGLVFSLTVIFGSMIFFLLASHR